MYLSSLLHISAHLPSSTPPHVLSHAPLSHRQPYMLALLMKLSEVREESGQSHSKCDTQCSTPLPFLQVRSA